jgi:SNF2 family DNA or RNA helicase
MRAVAVLQVSPPLRHLHLPNSEYVQPPKRGEPGYVKPKPIKQNDKTARNDIDYYSWFNEYSALFKEEMPETGEDFQRWRWILQKISEEAGSNDRTIPNLRYTDISKVSNKEVLDLILKFSPKITAVLSLLLKHCVIRDEKVILWFSYPITQSLVQEIMMALPWFKGDGRHMVLEQNTSAKGREDVATHINDPRSNRIGGVGLNFQKDSHVQIHFELADTLDAEAQTIGRQHRLGQVIGVIVYSLLLARTPDVKFIR